MIAGMFMRSVITASNVIALVLLMLALLLFTSNDFYEKVKSFEFSDIAGGIISMLL